jgi:hypothetical protein
MISAHHSFVIPANAGIHGRNYPAIQRVLSKLDGQAMDSCVRGNDNVGGFGEA